MAIIRRTIEVEASAENLYEVVFDIERYPFFLTWCDSSEILSRSSTSLKSEIKFFRIIYSYIKLSIRYTRGYFLFNVPLFILRKILAPMGTTEAMEFLLDKMDKTKTNADFFQSMGTK